jgi:3-oxoadipate enol-lactonase
MIRVMNARPTPTGYVHRRAGCPLHYWLAGPPEAPLVTFLHGMTLDHTMFDPQVEPFAEHYRVLSIDLRGHGRSQPLGRGFSIALLVEDLLAVLDELGIAQTALVGHSMGGMVAQELVFRHPERVTALVTYGIPCTTMPMPWWQALRKPIAPLARVLLRLAPYHRLMDRMATRMSEHPAIRAHIRAAMSRFTPDTFRRVVTALPDGRHAEPDYHVPCPLLLLRGEHDPYGGGAKAIAEWAARDRHAETAEIAGAGHNANQDDPDAFNLILLDFLRRSVPA